ncbi:hypothetical protein M378DRAFT_165775 [Amanita muscaria Koide BX008]|uniref:Uncharacterized protein n=1 Tax=Amanita muscaria (strain Koide BX008) TaxID=946122 RepID=A0A0C2T746_AMAMK|nr:hypothetical protein M378DRAFT_165775 [Amanita muscaria Koide BX008]
MIANLSRSKAPALLVCIELEKHVNESTSTTCNAGAWNQVPALQTSRSVFGVLIVCIYLSPIMSEC